MLPGAASIADARLEAASLAERPTSHIEEHGSANCARIHPADCAFCRVLATSAKPAPIAAPAPRALLRAPAPANGTARAERFLRGATRSRAPPFIG